MTTFTVVREFKEVSFESYDIDKTIITTENREEAEKVFAEQKAILQQEAEKNRLDYNLVLFEGDEDDPLYDAIEEAFADFQGESTDGMVAMVIKPKYYHTPYQVISGDEKNDRYFTEHKDDIRIKLIKAEELTPEAMKAYGFPQWFIEDYSIDSEFC